MTIDVLRGMRLGALGALCFLTVPIVVVVVVMAATTSPSNGDGEGMPIGVLLYFGGLGALGALLALVVLASIGDFPGPRLAAGTGALAGALFVGWVLWGMFIVPLPRFLDRHFESWLQSVVAAILAIATWFAVKALRSEHVT